MTKDDKPDDIALDLDALNNAPKSIKGVVLPKASHTFTLGELKELGKKDPAKLTEPEKVALETFNSKALETIGAAVKTYQERGIGAEIKRMLDNMPKPPQLYETKMPVLRPTPPPPTYAEQVKQTAKLAELVEKIDRQQQADHADIQTLLRPHYYADKQLLVFRNRLIDVTKGKEYEAFCKIMFRNGEPRTTPIQFGDLLDRLHVKDLKDTAHIRNLVKNFNSFIAKETMVNDLFYARKKVVHFEAKYL